jgi:hypothetical protein
MMVVGGQLPLEPFVLVVVVELLVDELQQLDVVVVVVEPQHVFELVEVKLIFLVVAF